MSTYSLVYTATSHLPGVATNTLLMHSCAKSLMYGWPKEQFSEIIHFQCNNTVNLETFTVLYSMPAMKINLSKN